MSLRRPRNFNNPGAFDYVGYLGRQGIRVTGSMWTSGPVERCNRVQHGPSHAIAAARRRIGAAIDEVVDPEPAGIIRALTIGDRSGLPQPLRETFARAGVAHILAISGLHLAIVAGAVFAALRTLVACSETLLVRGVVPRIAALGTLPVILLYGVLAGGRPPTVRAALMVAVYLAGVLWGRRSDILRSLALAALVMSMCWPGVAFDLSFQFSFVAVLSIVLGLRRLRAWWGGAFPGPPATAGTASGVLVRAGSPGGAPPAARIRKGIGGHIVGWVLASVGTSICASIGTLPLTALHFNMVSLVGPVTNLVAVPIFSAAVLTGLAGAVVSLGTPGWAAPPFWVAGRLVELGVGLVAWTGNAPGAAVDVVSPTVIELAIAYAALGCTMAWPRRGGRLLAAALVLVTVADGGYWVRQRYARSTLRVTFLDVGQGDAAVVEFPGSAVLVIDGGGFPGSDFDPGEAIVARFLWRRKIGRVDYVAMSHAETDHMGGLPFLIRTFRPVEFWWNGRPRMGMRFDRLRAVLDERRVRERILSQETPRWSIGPVEVAVLHPGIVGRHTTTSTNDSSLVLRLHWGITTVLFSGDIERAGEERLVGRGVPALKSSVLKVPHHGSGTSSGEAFLAAVQPHIAVVSVGARNRYGLPDPRVLARYRARGSCVLRTDTDGAVLLNATATGYRIDPPCGEEGRPGDGVRASPSRLPRVWPGQLLPRLAAGRAPARGPRRWCRQRRSPSPCESRLGRPRGLARSALVGSRCRCRRAAQRELSP
jgi:competence protein ComEC